MSSISTKQIDGDVAVGRNVSAGGNANIQGNVRVGHNLKVEGWLEARNIKYTNKGLFTSEEKLRQAYPQPEKGWWALVGNTLPADIYVECKGQWVATGEQGGEITVDFAEYGEAMQDLQNDVAELQEKDAELEASIQSQSGYIKNLGEQLNATQATAAEAYDKAENNGESIKSLNSSQETLAREVKSLSEHVEELDSARCPAVLPFAGFTAGGVEYKLQSLAGEVNVCYDAEHKLFLGTPRKSGDFPTLPGVSIGGGAVGGEFSLGAHVSEYNRTAEGMTSARTDRLFIDRNNVLWRFDGQTLAQVGGTSSNPVVLSQSEYDALDEPQTGVLYYIVERQA